MFYLVLENNMVPEEIHTPFTEWWR